MKKKLEEYIEEDFSDVSNHTMLFTGKVKKMKISVNREVSTPQAFIAVNKSRIKQYYFE